MIAHESIQKPVYLNDMGFSICRLGVPETTGQNRQVRTGLLRRDALLETGQWDDRGIIRSCRTFGEDHRSPDLYRLAKIRELPRHHTDNRMRVGVQAGIVIIFAGHCICKD